MCKYGNSKRGAIGVHYRMWDRKNKIYTKDTLTKDQKAKEALDFLPPANINRLFVAGHSRGGHG